MGRKELRRIPARSEAAAGLVRSSQGGTATWAKSEWPSRVRTGTEVLRRETSGAMSYVSRSARAVLSHIGFFLIDGGAAQPKCTERVCHAGSVRS